MSENNIQTSFGEIAELIQSAKQRAYRAVNSELVGLYWRVGEYISQKISSAEWGEGIVDQLAKYLAETQPGLRGFTRPNLFRMRQLYDTYNSEEKVSPLVTQLPWTHNLIILSRSKRAEEREFYLRMAIRERWGKRELERQFKASLFERTILMPPKVSPLVRQLQPIAEEVFKDVYSLEFLGLSEPHNESDLHGALIRNLGHFLTEQEHRQELIIGLNNVANVYLYSGNVSPERHTTTASRIRVSGGYTGKTHLNSQRKSRPQGDCYRFCSRSPVANEYERTVGHLDTFALGSYIQQIIRDDVLGRDLCFVGSEYKTQMPDKKLLQAKLHEFYQKLTFVDPESAS